MMRTSHTKAFRAAPFCKAGLAGGLVAGLPWPLSAGPSTSRSRPLTILQDSSRRTPSSASTTPARPRWSCRRPRWVRASIPRSP